MTKKPREPELRVRDVFSIDKTLAVVIDENAPFKEAVEKFASRPDLRGIFAVNGQGRLSGVITRQELLAWASLAFGSLGLRAGFSWGQLLHLANATTVKDACAPSSHLSAVHPDDPLDQVFTLMVTGQLIDVPVVDDDGRILGDIRLTEMIQKVLQVTEARAAANVPQKHQRTRGGSEE